MKMKMKFILTLALMQSMYPLTALSSESRIGESATIAEQFDERRQQLLSFADTTSTVNYFYAAAKLHRRTDLAGGVRMLEDLLADPSASSRGMFVIYELMAAYLYGKDAIPGDLQQRIRRSFRDRPLYRGDTENHWVMYYTGLYLAAQTWPGYDGTNWYTGKSSLENFHEAEGWLEEWMRITTTIGQGEFDSPTYHMVFLAPMLVLHQFAADPVMQKKAGMMVDYLLADFAVEHLEGMYCGAHSRDYPYNTVEPKKAPMTAWAWLFFGKPAPVMRPELLAAALSDYRMPEIIYHIATDRSQPYVHTETKRVRNVIRFGDERNPRVYKYIYMTADFALGSMQGGRILQPIQQHLWDVTYVSDKPHSTLFTVHPYVSGRELGMFFPEEVKFTVDEVARFHTYYGKEDKWVASSPYAETFQHRNAIIVLYDIPPGTRFPHIDGFFQKDLDERIYKPFDAAAPLAERWIFCRAGNTYIAYFPLKPYEWIEEEICWRLRSRELKNGCIVEAGRMADFASFEDFKNRIKATAIGITENPQEFTVKYTTSGGDRMQFTHGGARILNGTPVDFAAYGLFRGPFLDAEIGSGTLHMRYKNMQLDFDFNVVRP